VKRVAPHTTYGVAPTSPGYAMRLRPRRPSGGRPPPSERSGTCPGMGRQVPGIARSAAPSSASGPRDDVTPGRGTCVHEYPVIAGLRCLRRRAPLGVAVPPSRLEERCGCALWPGDFSSLRRTSSGSSVGASMRECPRAPTPSSK
jgi:hypothetical protein